MNREVATGKIKDAMLEGKLAPWKAEDAALEDGIPLPDNIVVAAMARRKFIEEKLHSSYFHGSQSMSTSTCLYHIKEEKIERFKKSNYLTLFSKEIYVLIV